VLSLEEVPTPWYGHCAKPLEEGGYGGDLDCLLYRRLRANSRDCLVIGDRIVIMYPLSLILYRQGPARGVGILHQSGQPVQFAATRESSDEWNGQLFVEIPDPRLHFFRR
jgi:hypothetical protein